MQRIHRHGLPLLLGVFLASSVWAQTPSEQLRTAIEQFEDDALNPEALPVFEALQDSPWLTVSERSQARKYLGLGYLVRNDEDAAVDVFTRLVGEDPDFALQDLAVSYEEAPRDYVVRFFAQATLQWRQEQLRRQRERLEQTSRRGALVRSLALPGLGQRYQGYRGRSWALMGMTGAAVIYAAATERSYRQAKDDYDHAPIGADFDGLWRDYSNKSDAADLAFGVVGAVWALNLVDAALSGPNLTGLESATLTPAVGADGRWQLALQMEF